MEEYMSLTHSSSGHFSITYDVYFTMIQTPCIRYDKSLKQNPSTTSRAVYQHELDEAPSVHDEEDDYLDVNYAPDGIDTPSDDIYNIHNTNFNRTLVEFWAYHLQFSFFNMSTGWFGSFVLSTECYRTRKLVMVI